MVTDARTANQWLDDWEQAVQIKLGLDYRDMAYLLGQRAYRYFLLAFCHEELKQGKEKDV